MINHQRSKLSQFSQKVGFIGSQADDLLFERPGVCLFALAMCPDVGSCECKHSKIQIEQLTFALDGLVLCALISDLATTLMTKISARSRHLL
jgi:hypothetical protein